jgi:hypothetical protein
MAFEAFVASGAARRDRVQRVVGLGVSLALHLPPLILFALQLVARPVLVERAEDPPGAKASPTVPVRIAGLWAPPPQRTEGDTARVRAVANAPSPNPAAARETTPARKRRAPPPPAPVATVAPPAAVDRPIARLDLPPDGMVPSSDTPAERPETLAMLHTVKPSLSVELERRAAAVRTEILAGLSADPSVPGDGDARPGPVHELTSGAAAYLRTYETFPSLPDGSWSWRKKSYVFFLQVCVADNGLVDEVVIQRGARPDLDAYLASAIRTWRYRPWIVSGSPRPFCHPLRITYSRG